MVMDNHLSKPERVINCDPREGGFLLSFFAMASPCEVLVDCSDEHLAITVGDIAAKEAWRIEDKFSRYQEQSVCGQLNANAGRRCAIDQETFQLLSFAQQCFELSDGLFDLTSGILRKAWRFDGSDNIPKQADVDLLLPLIGWHKTQLSMDSFQMLDGMELDFGGIGKEYAVDRAVLLIEQYLISQQQQTAFLVNFGGDLAVSGKRDNRQVWQVGIEQPSVQDKSKTQQAIVTLSEGAVATSGDAHRFLLKNNNRYSHVLNVKTGWPVETPPRAITVAAPKCIQAGFLATLALLQGQQAENFLTEQGIKFWAIR